MGNRPLLKLVGLLRSMEYATVDGRELALSALQPKIGQAAFESPSVFNYYLADFEPPGRLGAASFVQDKKKYGKGGTALRVVSFLGFIRFTNTCGDANAIVLAATQKLLDGPYLVCRRGSSHPRQ